jgi:hypothetical protein
MKKSMSFFKHVFYLLSIILLCLTSDVKAQLSNEIALSVGPVFVPQSTTDMYVYGATFIAKNGNGIQLDYKLMNRSVGIQLAVSYLINGYDPNYASNVLGASSYSDRTWYAITGLVKFVARAKAFKQKVFIDFSAGFGALQGNFPSQSFEYNDNSNPTSYVYSPEQYSSGMAFSTGIRTSYAIRDYMSVFVNYDFIYSAQNYTVVYQEVTSTGISSSTESNRIKRNYSTLFFGLLFPF